MLSAISVVQGGTPEVNSEISEVSRENTLRHDGQVFRGVEGISEGFRSAFKKTS